MPKEVKVKLEENSLAENVNKLNIKGKAIIIPVYFIFLSKYWPEPFCSLCFVVSLTWSYRKLTTMAVNSDKVITKHINQEFYESVL